jgi:hypothetical protein
MSDALRINNAAYSWGSISLKVADEQFTGFTALKYGDKRTRTKLWGMGKHHAPRARSRGKYEPADGSLKGPKSTVQALREKLASLASDGVSYGEVEFQVVANYVEPDETPITVELLRCVISSQDSNEEENPDLLQEEIGLDYMAVKRNGLTLYDSSGGDAP